MQDGANYYIPAAVLGLAVLVKSCGARAGVARSDGQGGERPVAPALCGLPALRPAHRLRGQPDHRGQQPVRPPRPLHHDGLCVRVPGAVGPLARRPGGVRPYAPVRTGVEGRLRSGDRGPRGALHPWGRPVGAAPGLRHLLRDHAVRERDARALPAGVRGHAAWPRPACAGAGCATSAGRPTPRRGRRSKRPCGWGCWCWWSEAWATSSSAWSN